MARSNCRLKLGLTTGGTPEDDAPIQIATSKLHPNLVSVKRISSEIGRDAFDLEELKQMARCILAAGGLVSPIVLRRNGIDGYQVVAREFEYWAAVTAREMEPAAGEMINAFIVDDETEEWIMQQLEGV